MPGIIEEFDNNDCHYELGLDKQGYFVRCWNAEDELHWEMRGHVVDDDGVRQTRIAYATEADARIELDKWRR